MKENPERLRAFDYYFLLGDERSIEAVALKFTRNVNTVYKWGRDLLWKERVEQRDIEVSRRLERKTDNLIIDAKAEYRSEIKNYLKTLKALLVSAVGKNEEGKSVLNIKVNNPKDITSIVSAYEKLIKLDLLVMGESTERNEDTITITIEE